MDEGRRGQRSQVRRSQYYKKPQRQDQYEQLEGEYKYARWFWNRGERATWSLSKIFVTFVASMFILAIGFITLSDLISPITAGIGMGTLVIMVLLANADIRGWTVRQVLRRRSYNNTRLVSAYDGLKFYFLENHEEYKKLRLNMWGDMHLKDDFFRIKREYAREKDHERQAG